MTRACAACSAERVVAVNGILLCPHCEQTCARPNCQSCRTSAKRDGIGPGSKR